MLAPSGVSAPSAGGMGESKPYGSSEGDSARRAPRLPRASRTLSFELPAAPVAAAGAGGVGRAERRAGIVEASSSSSS